MSPLVVCETAPAVAATLARLRLAGWTPVESLPHEPWNLAAARLVFHGDAANADVAQDALLAGVRGAGVVVLASTGETAVARLVEDLSRVGAVHLAGAEEGPRYPLTPEQRRLLDLLAHGASVVAAARAMNLSRRTTHRRLQEARAVLGVDSTAEAIAMLRDGETRSGPGFPVD
jgi:DNA-binding NarL/FixJ family response regulator